jgi:hypothetical protein
MEITLQEVAAICLKMQEAYSAHSPSDNRIKWRKDIPEECWYPPTKLDSVTIR